MNRNRKNSTTSKATGIIIRVNDLMYSSTRQDLFNLLHNNRINYQLIDENLEDRIFDFKIEIDDINTLKKISNNAPFFTRIKQIKTFTYKPFKSSILEMPKELLEGVHSWKLNIWKRIFDKVGIDFKDPDELGKSLRVDSKYKHLSVNVFILTNLGPRIDYYQYCTQTWQLEWFNERIYNKYLPYSYNKVIEKINRYIDNYINNDNLTLFNKDVDKWITNPSDKTDFARY